MTKRKSDFLNRLFFLFIFIPLSHIAAGQGDDGYRDPNYSKNFADFRDLSGKAIPLGSQVGVEGTMMLNEQFTKGMLKLSNGKVYNGLEMNLSLVNNQLYFRKDSLVLQVATPVSDFVLPATGKANEKTLHFKTGYPAIGSNTGQTYYEVLAEGPKVHLLKYMYKIVQVSSNYGGPTEKAYVQREFLYVYDVQGASMTEISHNTSAVKKALPEYAAEIENFSAQNKSKLKKEEEIKALVEYLNVNPK